MSLCNVARLRVFKKMMVTFTSWDCGYYANYMINILHGSIVSAH